MESFDKAVVILGIGPKPTANMTGELAQFVASAIEKTVGTGILFAYKEHLWILSCRHVIENTLPGETDTYKAIIKLLATDGEVEKLTIVLNQSSLRYHPFDTKDESYDLAIFWVGLQKNINQPITPIQFTPNYTFLPLVPDMDLQAFGYPVNSLSLDIVHNVDSLLPLTSVTAKFLDGPSTGKQPINHSKRQLSTYTAETNSASDLSGMSGGLVVAKKETQFYPIGMLTGSGTGRVIDNRDGKERNVSFITFAHLSSLLHALSKLVT